MCGSLVPSALRKRGDSVRWVTARRDKRREIRRQRRERARVSAGSRGVWCSQVVKVGTEGLAGYYWKHNKRSVSLGRLYELSFDERYAEAERRARVRLPATGDPDEDVIRAATIDTAYATFYRVHSRAHFRHGGDFPLNWVPWPAKAQRPERYSPPGVVGWYLGLTIGAALDEALYYGGDQIDQTANLLLTVECCLSNVLYLGYPRILSAVWAKVGLPPLHPYEMLLALMHPETSAEHNNQIGLWARARGFAGIVFPTARYAQRLYADDCRGVRDGTRTFLPVVNHIGLHSRLDLREGGPHVRAALDIRNIETYLRERSISRDAVVEVPAELNVVLFAGDQLDGSVAPVFYQSRPLSEWREAAAEETRRPIWPDRHRVVDVQPGAFADSQQVLDEAVAKGLAERIPLGDSALYKLKCGQNVVVSAPRRDE
jgi:hypothetical protein